MTGAKRDSNLPDTPTVRELGYAGLEVADWQGLGGPVGLPCEVVNRLAAALRQVLESADVRAKLLAGGAEVNARGAADSAAYVKMESERWAALISQRGIKLD